MITIGTLTSRERVLLALDHKEPDRVPVDLGGTVVTGISRIALRNYLEFRGISAGPVAVNHLSGQLGLVPESLLRELGVDVRPLNPNPPTGGAPLLCYDRGHPRFTDEWGIGWEMPASSYYFDMYEHPLARAGSVEDVIEHQWPDATDSARYRGLWERGKQLSAEDATAVVAGRMGAGIFELSLWLRGFEQFYTDLACDPGLACSILDKVLEIKMDYWSRLLEEGGDSVTVVGEADDLASQNGLLISPEMYRKYIKPRHAKLFSHIKRQAPHVRIFLHSCGAVFDLIEDLIESGVDILNPVQTSARGMDPVRLKRVFGQDVVFWGAGVDTQNTLPYGSAQDVRDNVRRALDVFAPGGGYVFATIHNIQADVPPANIAALFEAFEDYRGY